MPRIKRLPTRVFQDCELSSDESTSSPKARSNPRKLLPRKQITTKSIKLVPMRKESDDDTHNKSLLRCSNSTKNIRYCDEFPERKLQKKIEKYMGPYNDQLHILRFMDFDPQNKTENLTIEDNTTKISKWKNVSDLILKHDPKTLRDTMRCLNGALYDRCEELSKVMAKKRIKRSRVKDPAFYRIESIQNRHPVSRKSSLLKRCESIKNIGKLQKKRTFLSPTDNHIEIPESEISKVFKAMKIASSCKRSETPIKISKITNDQKSELMKSDFEDYLNKLKCDMMKKPKQHSQPTQMPDSPIKIPKFEPIGKALLKKMTALSPKNSTKGSRLGVRVPQRRQESTQFYSSGKNVLGGSPLLKQNHGTRTKPSSPKLLSNGDLSTYQNSSNQHNPLKIDLKSVQREESSKDNSESKHCDDFKQYFEQANESTRNNIKLITCLSGGDFILPKISERSIYESPEPLSMKRKLKVDCRKKFSQRLSNTYSFKSTEDATPNISNAKKVLEVLEASPQAKVPEAASATIYTKKNKLKNRNMKSKSFKNKRKCIALDDIIFDKLHA